MVLPGSLQNILLKQAMKLRERMTEIRKELEEVQVEGTAGGGAVRAIASGLGELLEVRIDPQVVNPNEVEMLQDLIVAAVRDAMKQAEDVESEKMTQLTGGLKIPGLFP